jgi:hypothetical protein
VSGLLSGSAAVRATALAALPHVPTLAEGVAPESEEVTAVLALSRHDVNEDNAAAAEALWQQVGDPQGHAGARGSTSLSVSEVPEQPCLVCWVFLHAAALHTYHVLLCQSFDVYTFL